MTTPPPVPPSVQPQVQLPIPQKKSNAPIIITIIVVGLVLLVAIGVGVVAMIGANAVTTVANMKVVPVTCTFRSSQLMGISENSFVATLRNEGALLRDVTVTVNNPSLQKSKVYTFQEWSPGQVREIGWQEGWRMYPGDTILIQCQGWKGMQYTFGHP